ncbi:MAG TPA: tetratricopeptide repeat protein [Cytophagaceae bacterium]
MAEVANSQTTLIRSSDDANFRSGLELFDQAKYGHARILFEKYIAQNEQSNKRIDAEYYVAYSALNLFHADAEKLFKDFIAKYPYHSKASSAYYDLGTFYYNNKKYDKAIEYLKQVNFSQLSPEQAVEAKFRLGYSYFTQKDFANAGVLFNEIKMSDHKYTYASAYYAAYIEYKNGDYEAALADLKKAENSEAYKPLVPLMIVNVYYKKGDYDKLLEYAEDVLKKNEKVSGADEIFLLTAEAYFKKEDFKKAADYFKKYATESKSKLNEEIQFRLAFSEYKTGLYKEAANDFKVIAASKDSLGQASSYYLGVSYIKLDNKPFALAAFDQSRKGTFSKRFREEALFSYAKLNFDLEKYTEALPTLKEYIKVYPNGVHEQEVHELLSESFLLSNNYSEAITYIEGLKSKSARISAAYQNVTLSKGIEHFNNGKYTEALAMFDKSLEYPLEKDLVASALYWKGETFSVLKEYDNAINAYAQVFPKASSESQVHLNSRYGIGYAYYNTKQFEKAMPHFKEYVAETKNSQSKQNYFDALLRLADLYFVTKKYDEAIKNYDEVVTQKGADIDYAYFQKGVVLGLDNRSAEAIQSFDVVIKKYASSLYFDDALFQKAELELENSNYNGASEGFSSIINLKSGSPFVPYAHLKRAIAYSNLQRHNDAVNDYKIILNTYPGHPVAQNALLGLQESLASAGRAEEMSTILTKYKELNPKSEALVNIEFENAKTLYSDQKYKPASEALVEYITAYPESPNRNDAHYYLAESYFKIKDTSLAATNFRVVLEDKTSSFYNKSVQRLAEIKFANGAYQSSKDYYLLLAQTARNKKERYSAWTGLMDNYNALAQQDSVVFYANEILNSGGATPDAESKSLLYLGKFAYNNKDFDKALDYFVNAVNGAKDANAAEASFLIADIQYKQGKHKQSLETLYNLNNEYPTHDKWLGKSFLLIAENFVALNEMFQAKATLNSIIEKSPHKESVEKAKVRLEELNKG